LVNSNNQKPCVVNTPQGFSVSYKDLLLYSKYNPSKLITNSINNLSILPGTIILCMSPVLEYGLNELYNKLPANCIMILCEAEKELFDFIIQNNSFIKNNSSILIPEPQSLDNLPVKLYDLCTSGKYKRVIRVDFSAGTQFHKDYYNELEAACINSAGTFWKNRITLTKFGRKYSQNLFKNLKNLAETTPITDYFHKITKPILVFGAGQSIDLFFENTQISSEDYFILCADTALQPLLKRKIVPQGVFVEEAQTVILKAFIGAYNKVHLFAGLSSLPSLSRFFKPENISFFTTEYTSAEFLNDLYTKSFLPPRNKPYGSVGLTTVFYALQFRKDDSIPVYIAGLDFSYSAGFTHGKNTLAHITRITNHNKLIPIENYNAAWSAASIKISDKNNSPFITTPSLENYGNLFNNFFGNTHNLFDSSLCGLPLSLPRVLPQPLNSQKNNFVLPEKNIINTTELSEYLSNEKHQLLKLKGLLTGEISIETQKLEDEIKKIAVPREYLYLHFPDGYSFQYNQSFLNRIRTEIDFFLKIFD